MPALRHFGCDQATATAGPCRTVQRSRLQDGSTDDRPALPCLAAYLQGR